MPFVEHLREAVRAAELPQREIALAANIHPNIFAAFMQRRRGISVQKAEQVAALIGFTIALVPAANAERQQTEGVPDDGRSMDADGVGNDAESSGARADPHR